MVSILNLRRPNYLLLFLISIICAFLCLCFCFDLIHILPIFTGQSSKFKLNKKRQWCYLWTSDFLTSVKICMQMSFKYVSTYLFVNFIIYLCRGNIWITEECRPELWVYWLLLSLLMIKYLLQKYLYAFFQIRCNDLSFFYYNEPYLHLNIKKHKNLQL